MLKINNNLILKSISFVGVFMLMFAVSSPTTEAYATKASYKVYEGGISAGTNVPEKTSTPVSVDTCKNEAPKISSISPSTVNVNSGARKVKIVGTCFTRDSIARFNSANRATTYLDSKNLEIALTSNDTKALGKFLITVQDPKGFSNSKYFTVVNPVAKTKKSTGTVAKVTNDKIACETSSNLAEKNDKDTSSLVAGAIFAGDDLMPDSLLGWIFLFVFILLAVSLWRKLYVTDKERNTPLKHA